MRAFETSKENFPVLYLLSEGYGINKIARMLNRSKSGISKHAQNFVNHEYLIRDARVGFCEYRMTPYGKACFYVFREDHPDLLEEIISSRGGANGRTPHDKVQDRIRWHRIQLKFPLVKPLQQDNLTELLILNDHPISVKHDPLLTPSSETQFVSLNRLQGHSDPILHFQRMSVVLRPRNMIIAGLEFNFDADIPAEEYQANILAGLAPTIDNLQYLLRKTIPAIRVRREARGVYHLSIISSEFAYERHPLALEYAKNGQKLDIRDPLDGKRRIGIDFSKGFAELETFHPALSAYDMGRLQENPRAYIESFNRRPS
jgi:hypothetical protein